MIVNIKLLSILTKDLEPSQPSINSLDIMGSLAFSVQALNISQSKPGRLPGGNSSVFPSDCVDCRPAL